MFPPHQQPQVRVQLAFVLLAVIAQQLIPHASGSGRVLATEILLRNHAVANHIREGKTHQTRAIMESAKAEGMVVLDDRLLQLYANNLITFEELARRVTSPTTLKRANRPPGTPAAG